MNDTRTKILDVAEEMVQSVGVNAVSYKHISDEVGIPKASIHHHFPKKDDLIDELLSRCQTSYGEHYTGIVTRDDTAPIKPLPPARVFENGLAHKKLCLVGSLSMDRNTLQDSSCRILERSIHNTVGIFAQVFKQGREENSLSFTGTDTKTAYAFLSFLVCAQIAARAMEGRRCLRKRQALPLQHSSSKATIEPTENIIRCSPHGVSSHIFSVAFFTLAPGHFAPSKPNHFLKMVFE